MHLNYTTAACHGNLINAVNICKSGDELELTDSGRKFLWREMQKLCLPCVAAGWLSRSFHTVFSISDCFRKCTHATSILQSLKNYNCTLHVNSGTVFLKTLISTKLCSIHANNMALKISYLSHPVDSIEKT